MKNGCTDITRKRKLLSFYCRVLEPAIPAGVGLSGLAGFICCAAFAAAAWLFERSYYKFPNRTATSSVLHAVRWAILNFIIIFAGLSIVRPFVNVSEGSRVEVISSRLLIICALSAGSLLLVLVLRMMGMFCKPSDDE